jgi:transposase
LTIHVALEPVYMRFGYDRLGGIVRERMQTEPRSRALFVFVGKGGHTMKVLTWDGTGVISFTRSSTLGGRVVEADVHWRATSDGV